MHEFTHPVELHDEQLDLVAAAGGGCGCHGSLIDADVDVDIKDNQTNIAGVTVGDLNQQNFR
ncbi:MAG: hypothetical protein ACJ8EL_08355 [Rhizomicrobium sp.]